MASVDPIVQCAACGAKLRLKAASLKVLKQVRCGKCQSMIEIPEILKSGGPIPEEPVLAKTPVSDDAPSAHETAPPAPAPRPTPAASAAPSPKPTPAPTPSAPPAPPAPPAPDRSAPPAAVTPSSPAPADPAPVPTPSAVPPRPHAAPVNPSSVAGFPRIPEERDLVTRLDMLETKVNLQQESIALLTAQVRQIVKAQATAVEAAQAILDR